MKLNFLGVLVLVLAGCSSLTLDEINYVGKPLRAGTDPFVEAERFAVALSREAGLEVTYRTKPLGIDGFDAQAEVDLKSARSPQVVARVLVDAPKREIQVMIQPASHLPAAEELAAASVRTYQRLYGNSKFMRWQRYRELLGP